MVLNTLILIGLITGLALLSNVNLTQGIVKAQTETLVSVEPDSISLIMNTTTTIDIQVINGLNINAFDVKIVYNPDIVNLESWSLGDYLSNLAQIKKEQTPGLLRLVYTQLATPSVSGDGILLHLVFKGVAVGNAPVAIEAISFADSAGNLTYPETSDGVIIVQSTVSPTAASTITQTLTRTPTQTRTQSPNPSATGTLTTPSGTLTSVLPETTFTNTPGTTETVTEQVRPTEEQNPDETRLVSETGMATNTPLNDENPSNGGDTATQEGSSFQETSEINENERKNETLNKVLWVLLIIFIFSIAIMVFILIKRKKTEHLKEW